MMRHTGLDCFVHWKYPIHLCYIDNVRRKGLKQNPKKSKGG